MDSAAELKVSFYPPLHLQRRIWILDVLRRENVTSVLDIGCGEGSLLAVLCQPAPWLPPPDENNPSIRTTDRPSKHHDRMRSPTSPKGEIKSLHPTHVVGLDVSSPDLEFAAQATAPTPPSPHTGIRWEPLEVKIWKGGLECFNPEFVGVECVVSTEVIEHLPEDIAADFAPVILGLYQPLLFLCTTPSYTFNARFTVPDTEEAGRTGYPDPTGRTKRIFRHDDHKFEWTVEEFKDWCEGVAKEWGYEVNISSVGRAVEADEWGRDEELGGASQVAEFRRKDDKQHQESREKKSQSVREKAAGRTKHELLVTHQHNAHPNSRKPGPLPEIGDRVKAKMEEYREGFMKLEEMWFTQEIAILCGGWIEVLVKAIDAHEKLALHSKEDTETRSWQVELVDGVMEPNDLWPKEGETSLDHIPPDWLPQEEFLSPWGSETDGREADVSQNNSDDDVDSERAEWGSVINSGLGEGGDRWGGSSESETDDVGKDFRWPADQSCGSWKGGSSNVWDDDPDEPEASHLLTTREG